MPNDLRGKAVIAGAVDIVSPSGMIGQSTQALQLRAVREALDDAGLQLSDVDGVCTTGSSMGLAELLGITPKFTDSTTIGGCSYLVHVEHAAAAVALGMCDVAISVHVQIPQTARRNPAAAGGGGFRPPGGLGASPMMEWEMPYGLLMPIGGYALIASHHMGRFGTKAEHLAQIAVSTRQWASMNPNARFQDAITIDDVLSSAWVAEPFHLLDCCVVTDGAGCVVVTRADRAAALRRPPVYVLGAGTAHTHSLISQMPDMSVSAAAVSGPKAFSMAGITPSDVDVAELYDAFTITPLMALEDLGFCAKGEGGPLVSDGKLGPGGSLPTNTNGGGLSYCHSGMYGMFLLVEAVRQLRGECGPRQVTGAEIAVAHGWGGVMGAASTLVLGTTV
jgi:acetyl-CoA acetyltransferase